MIDKVILKPLPGIKIKDIAEAMVAIAEKIDEDIELDFNGIKLTANGDTLITDVIIQFYEAWIEELCTKNRQKNGAVDKPNDLDIILMFKEDVSGFDRCVRLARIIEDELHQGKTIPKLDYDAAQFIADCLNRMIPKKVNTDEQKEYKH